MALKLEMSKAYDGIEWEFVEKMLLSMGFPEKIISLIVECISIFSYDILTNGYSSKRFSLKRGLDHVDPLPHTSSFCMQTSYSALSK